MPPKTLNKTEFLPLLIKYNISLIRDSANAINIIFYLL
jgi:hypothetical protein